MITTVQIVRVRSLFATVMLTGIFSLLGAGWMMTLDAPDVAFTEAAVGAGIATVLMLSTLALTTRRSKTPTGNKLLPLLVVGVTGALLVWATLDMPHLGDPSAPVHQHVAPRYLAQKEIHGHAAQAETGVPNVVTAVLGSYRGYDTLGETTVIFTAAVGVMLVLGGRRRRNDAEKKRKNKGKAA